MGKIIKFLIYLVFFGFLALVAYAYVGPFFGVDFSPETQEIRKTIQLDAN